jgi:hypothetical protein
MDQEVNLIKGIQAETGYGSTKYTGYTVSKSYPTKGCGVETRAGHSLMKNRYWVGRS